MGGLQVFPMKTPKISIIMLMHNREKYVGQAIESILAQTFSDFEFIIIDNKSTDASANIAAGYDDSRISIYKNTNSNIGSGRNLGIAKARGEYFGFIDDDDYAKPDYLGFLVGLAEKHGADIAVCGSEYDFDGTIKPKYVFDEMVLCGRAKAVEYFLLRKYFNSGNPTKLFRRTGKIAEVKFPEQGRYDDIHTMYRFFCATGGQPVAVAAKGEPLYVVRRNTENNSAATLEHKAITPGWLDEYRAAYRERTAYISALIPALGKVAKWSELSFMISMVEKITRLSLSDCAEYRREMAEELKTHRVEFLSAKWTRDFEKEWMEAYIR